MVRRKKKERTNFISYQGSEFKLFLLFPGDEDGKEDDGQSVASVGEEYEPISDDELDEILADSQKKEDQPEDEKATGT